MAQKIKLELTQTQASLMLSQMRTFRSELSANLLSDEAKKNRRLFDAILSNYNRVDNVINQLREPVLI